MLRILYDRSEEFRMPQHDPTNIRITLDTVRRYRSKSEYRPVARARSGQFEAIGDGMVIRDLCRVLSTNNYPIDALVEVWRGEVLCFRLMPLKQWCRTQPFGGDVPQSLRAQTVDL